MLLVRRCSSVAIFINNPFPHIPNCQLLHSSPLNSLKYSSAASASPLSNLAVAGRGAFTARAVQPSSAPAEEREATLKMIMLTKDFCQRSSSQGNLKQIEFFPTDCRQPAVGSGSGGWSRRRSALGVLFGPNTFNSCKTKKLCFLFGHVLQPSCRGRLSLAKC